MGAKRFIPEASNCQVLKLRYNSVPVPQLGVILYGRGYNAVER